MFNTVSPALAFQYVSDNMGDMVDRVPPYTDNLNSWLGQILQRDAPHIPVEIVDVETTGYVLRLCPFEDVAMVGLAPEDVESFLQCVDEKCAILNATVTQRTKFMELIELEPSVQVGISIYIYEASNKRHPIFTKCHIRAHCGGEAGCTHPTFCRFQWGI